MNVRCGNCFRVYDDATRWTICPHSPLGGWVDDLCPKCDTLKSVHGPCKHQIKTEVVEVMPPVRTDLLPPIIPPQGVSGTVKPPISTQVPTPIPVPVLALAPETKRRPVFRLEQVVAPGLPLCDECGTHLPSGIVCNIYGNFCSRECCGNATVRKRALRRVVVNALLPLYVQEQVNDWLEANSFPVKDVKWAAIPVDFIPLMYIRRPFAWADLKNIIMVVSICLSTLAAVWLVKNYLS